MSCQLDDGEIALPQSALNVVEAHSDWTPEQRFLDTVSHDHAVVTGTVLWTSRPEPATSEQRWSGGGWVEAVVLVVGALARAHTH